MDDFYGDNKRGGNDDGFFTTPSNTPGFYKSAPRDLAAPLAPAGRAAANPFDAPAVDFEDEESRRAEGFFDEGTRAPDAAVSGAQRPNRTEGDDKYPWNLGFWMNFFDVDTKDILLRIVRSLIPFRRAFVDSIKTAPDLWAPFWICSTLIFFMTWTGNMASYFDAAIKGDLWEPSVEKLPWGAMAVYGYWLVVPLVFWAVFRWKEVKTIPLLVCYCIFGYSLFVYIPVSIIATLALGPIQWLAWVLIMSACAWSTLILCLSFFFLVHDENFKPGYFMLLFMALASVGLGLSFKLYFFDYYFDVNLAASTTTSGTSAPFSTSTTAAFSTTTSRTSAPPQ